MKVRTAADGEPLRWQVGAARVTRVVESGGSSPPNFLFAGLSAERVRSHVRADRRRPVHAHAYRPLGWNTRLVGGRCVPTFANARYLFGCAEYAHWRGAGAADEREVLADSVQPVVDAGLADWVESDHAVTGEVALEPTPGHTPGHVSVRIRSAGAEAVITGDLMHHPIQCCEPRIGSRFDIDPDVARETRLRFLREQADRPVLVLGTHFAAPTAGRVVSAGAAWELAVTTAESAVAGPSDRSPRR